MGGVNFRKHVSNPPKMLYKYFKSIERVMDTIEGQYIHFETPDTYNDVFDSAISVSEEDFKRMPFAGLTKSKIEPAFILYGADYDLSEIKTAYDAFKLLENYLSESELDILKYGFIKPMKNVHAYNNKVSCFSEVNDSLLMWAHYGDSLKGACLCFDTSKDSALFSNAQKVQYTNLRPRIGNFNEYFTKSIDWSYEQEWRIVVDQKEDIIHTNSCVGIIIGEKYPFSKAMKLQRFASTKGLNVFLAETDRDIYRVNIVKWS